MKENILNDIFTLKNNNSQQNDNDILKIDIDNLVDYKKSQPFSLYDNDKLEQMKESIKRNGVLVPIIVRSIDNGIYEILAGHNRVKCCKELGIDTITSRIINCDDDVATLIMIETNLCQREDIKLSEKGRAYKLQLDTFKKLKLDVPLGHTSIENLSKESEDSQTQIKRLIRVTELINEFQEIVDNKGISLRAAVELSYIKEEEQKIVYDVITNNNFKISQKNAEDIRGIKGNITEDKIIKIFRGIKVEKSICRFTGKINKDICNKYKDKFINDEEFSNVVDVALEKYFNN